MAYTTASVTRTVTSNVAADDAAVIGLEAGSVAAVTQNGNGQLEVDTGTTNSDGLNGDASFTYGDTGNPSSTNAFSVTNNDGSTQEITVGLTGMNLPGSSSFTLKFYESGPSHLGDATPSGDFTHEFASTDTVYVVIEVDTTGATSSDDFSGEMTFTA